MNDLGWTSPLYILAFDHRNTFAEHMFGGKKLEDLTPEEQAEVLSYKQLIYQGFQQAIGKGIPKDDAAILVDEEYGDAVLREAASDGIKTILTIEKSGQKSFAFGYGDEYPEHIEKYHPTFTKVLIHYNPSDTDDLKNAQQKNLKIISDYSHTHGYKFLLEVLVAGTPEQLATVNNDQEQYDARVRPGLTVDVIKELQNAGVEPDIWKMEGLESKESYEKVIQQARVDGRSEVSLVILGRGAGEEKVEEWLRLGSAVPGVVGFAVGRTIFWQPLMDVHTKAMSRDEAAKKISDEFYKLYSVFKEVHIYAITSGPWKGIE